MTGLSCDKMHSLDCDYTVAYEATMCTFLRSLKAAGTPTPIRPTATYFVVVASNCVHRIHVCYSAVVTVSGKSDTLTYIHEPVYRHQSNS